MIDDDEEIREIGADIVSKSTPEARQRDLYRVPDKSFSSASSSQRILQFILCYHSGSLQLWLEALRRLFPTSRTHNGVSNLSDAREIGSEANFFRLRTAREVLDQAMVPDTALFTEEKQNLYVDEVQEAKIWSEMLAYVHPRRDMRELNQRLCNWTIEGLSVLAQTANEKTDGPLGWTSRPEVFTIGMRVIYAAKIMFKDPKVRGPSALEVTVKERELCREGLEKLLEVGLKNDLHELWIMEIKDILGSIYQQQADKEKAEKEKAEKEEAEKEPMYPVVRRPGIREELKQEHAKT